MCAWLVAYVYSRKNHGRPASSLEHEGSVAFPPSPNNAESRILLFRDDVAPSISGGLGARLARISGGIASRRVHESWGVRKSPTQGAQFAATYPGAMSDTSCRSTHILLTKDGALPLVPHNRSAIFETAAYVIQHMRLGGSERILDACRLFGSKYALISPRGSRSLSRCITFTSPQATSDLKNTKPCCPCSTGSLCPSYSGRHARAYTSSLLPPGTLSRHPTLPLLLPPLLLNPPALMRFRPALVSLATCSFVFMGTVAQGLPSTYPHNYGEPSGDYSPQWQSYFQVTNPLPGVDFTLPRSYAGNIAVQRAGHPNDTLFFWAFEHQNGSLASPAGANAGTPWAVWLQGGPGASSMIGLMSENGPITVQPNTLKLASNRYAWSNLVDYVWVDQPVGVGFSTSDSLGYAVDEVQVASDFVGFLSNLVKVFPSLATRPFFLTGESYAGRYIPYIARALFSMQNPPVRLSKIAVGDPAFGSLSEFRVMPTLTLLETYPQIIGYDTKVYDYFKQRSHSCGFDVNLTYPQTGGILRPVSTATKQANPKVTVTDVFYHDGQAVMKASAATSRSFADEVAHRFKKRRASGQLTRHEGERLRKRAAWTAGVANVADAASPYGCNVWEEMLDYAANYTFPWSKYGHPDVTFFDVPEALYPQPDDRPTSFLRNSDVVKALHAPQSFKYNSSIDYPWNSQENGHDRSPEPMTFFTELATNASTHGVRIITYVGNNDGISAHFGTEVTIQNTTFGGIQGFTRKPSTAWFNDNGTWAGIVHQERNWTYALIYGAGHEVPTGQPVSAYTFFREFVLGNNQTGLVVTSGNTTSVIGGENPTLGQTAIPGQLDIYYGSATTKGSTRWPSATVAAFMSYISQVAITGTAAIKPPTATPTAT